MRLQRPIWYHHRVASPELTIGDNARGKPRVVSRTIHIATLSAPGLDVIAQVVTSLEDFLQVNVCPGCLIPGAAPRPAVVAPTEDGPAELMPNGGKRRSA